MLRPVGPLSATVYWRRRAVLVAATVGAFALVGWLMVSLTRGPSAGSGAPPAALGAGAATSTTAPTTPVPTTTAPTTTANPDPPTPSSSASAATSALSAPAPPLTCADTAIGLTAAVAAPSYPVGQEPVFRILVTNTSTATCVRDLDAGLQQVLVYSADRATRLWSSNDCFPGKSVDAPAIKPGEVKTFSVKWSGTSSEPTCQAVRTPLPAGGYVAVVRLAGLTSAPVPFSLS